MQEINRTKNEDRLNELLGVIKELDLEELWINEDIEELAEKYIEAGLLPEKYLNKGVNSL